MNACPSTFSPTTATYKDRGSTLRESSVTSMMGKGGADTAKPTLYCYRYMLTFSEEKVLKQWKREECVPGTRETLTTK